jgi:rubrerythrin
MRVESAVPLLDKEIDSREAFYAHALAIEREAAARYWEFAHQLLLYRENAVAQVFLDLARLEAEHLENLEWRAAGMKLPRLAPSEHCWHGLQSPGVPLPVAHCLMNPRRALEIALENEKRASDFYKRMSVWARDPAIRRLAAEMGEEEAQHIAFIERALREERPLRPAQQCDHGNAHTVPA